MAIKVKIPRGSSSQAKSGKKRKSDFHFGDPVVKIGVSIFLVACLVLFGVFAYYYVKYEKIIDRKMKGQIFNNAAKIYARPQVVRVGDKYSVDEIVSDLRRAGYTVQGHKPESQLGTYRLAGSAVESASMFIVGGVTTNNVPTASIERSVL